MTHSLVPIVSPGRLADMVDQLESHRVVNDVAALFLDGLPGRIGQVSELELAHDTDASRTHLRELEASAQMLGADRLAARAHDVGDAIDAGGHVTPSDLNRLLAIAAQTDEAMRDQLCASCSSATLGVPGAPESLRGRAGSMGSATCPVPRDGAGCTRST